MVHQIEFTLRPRRRGFHLITDEVLQHLQALPRLMVPKPMTPLPSTILANGLS